MLQSELFDVIAYTYVYEQVKELLVLQLNDVVTTIEMCDT